MKPGRNSLPLASVENTAAKLGMGAFLGLQRKA